MSETLGIPSAIELRAELEGMVRKDLLGVVGGPCEELDEANVRGRYIVGLLAPRGQSLLPDEQDDLAVAGSPPQTQSRTLR